MRLSKNLTCLAAVFLVGGLVWGAQDAKSAAPAKSQPTSKSAATKTPAPGQSSAPLSETIKGEVKEQLDIQKPPPSIDLDVKEIIESGTAQTDHVMQETRPIPSEEDFQHYSVIDSNQVLRPWKSLIPEPPLVSFKPGLAKVASKRWEFRVSDQTGENVKIIQGKGVPPREINWDGRNERGEYIAVGTLYSYQFLTFDEHENVHTFPGDPFQLDALMFKQKRKLCIEFSNEKLFVAGTADLKPNIQSLWDRAIDVIRENSNQPLTVEMYVENTRAPIEEERRQKIINMISDATNIPGVDIRHKIEKLSDRGNVTRLVLNQK